MIQNRIQKEIQKGLVQASTYKSQLFLSKLKSKRAVSVCGEQARLKKTLYVKLKHEYESLRKSPENSILLRGIRKIGVWKNNYERYLWLRRLFSKNEKPSIKSNYETQ